MEGGADNAELTRSPGPQARHTPETIGQSSPLGATVCHDGVNFSVFSRGATNIELLFFDHRDDTRPARVICIDPCTNVPPGNGGPCPTRQYPGRIEGSVDPSLPMKCTFEVLPGTQTLGWERKYAARMQD